jgi:prophage tail gpP-like protein
MPPEELRLLVSGSEISGWEEIELSRSMEAVAGSFSLKASDRSGWPVPTRAACELWFGDQQLLTGFVDSIEAMLSDTEHSLSVKGRDKTCDLVDCSTMVEDLVLSDLDLYQIATILCDPFGIVVVQAVDVGDPFYSFARQPGETAFEALERACRLRAVLPTTDGLGRLVLTRARTEGSSFDLVEGENLRSASVTLDASGRYATYVVRSQTQGTDLSSGTSCSGPEGRASDPLARTGRTLLILAEGALDDQKAQRRAEWERAVRVARSQVVTAHVQGWRQGLEGAVWQPNQLVQVYAPTLRVDAEMLVVSVKLSLSIDSGQMSELSLCRGDAYKPEHVPTSDDDLAQGFEQEAQASDDGDLSGFGSGLELR